MKTTLRPGRVRRGLAISATVAAAGACLVLTPPTASAAPGDNGDVKIHSTLTAFDDQRNEPKVCRFYLAAFNFDGLQEVTWTIDPQPAQKGTGHLDGEITLAPDGTGHTGPLTLPNGQYKLEWTFAGENGKAKQKVFKVSCLPITSTGGGTGGTTGGGTTGGGTVKDVFGNVVPSGSVETGAGSAAASIDPVKAGAGIALAGGAALFVGYRMLRRSRGGRPSDG